MNRTEIDPQYRKNPEELVKIIRTIDLVKNDTNVLISNIDIHGFASPEGSYANNVRLAKERSNALKDYVRVLHRLPDNLFRVEFTAEDWDGCAVGWRLPTFRCAVICWHGLMRRVSLTRRRQESANVIPRSTVVCCRRSIRTAPC